MKNTDDGQSALYDPKLNHGLGGFNNVGTKAGNFLAKKFFHPSSKTNLRKTWEAEEEERKLEIAQKDMQRKRDEELRVEIIRRQGLISREDRRKQELYKTNTGIHFKTKELIWTPDEAASNSALKNRLNLIRKKRKQASPTALADEPSKEAEEPSQKAENPEEPSETEVCEPPLKKATVDIAYIFISLVFS